MRERSRQSNKTFQTITEVTMATKRLESSQQRLMEKINEGKKYLENEIYNINELTRIKKTIEKKKLLFDKDVKNFEESTEKDEEKLNDFEEIQIQADDLLDDFDHYINIGDQRQ